MIPINQVILGGGDPLLGTNVSTSIDEQLQLLERQKQVELLSQQLKIVKKLKGKIIDTTDREMEMFRKFREFSKQNPTVTYEEFVKANM